MSKAYGLPGLRIGWIATSDRQLLVKMERIKHYLSICNSRPSERLATIALKMGARIIERNNGILRNNILPLEEFFAEFPEFYQWYRPDGGCVGYPRYRGPESVDEFVDDLVERTGVLLLAANVFQSALTEAPRDRFRMGYGRTDLVRGLDVMRDYLFERQKAG